MVFSAGQKLIISCLGKNKGSPEERIRYLPILNHLCSVLNVYVRVCAIGLSQANSGDGQAACIRSQNPKVSHMHSCQNWHTALISAY